MFWLHQSSPLHFGERCDRHTRLKMVRRGELLPITPEEVAEAERRIEAASRYREAIDRKALKPSTETPCAIGPPRSSSPRHRHSHRRSASPISYDPPCVRHCPAG